MWVALPSRGNGTVGMCRPSTHLGHPHLTGDQVPRPGLLNNTPDPFHDTISSFRLPRCDKEHAKIYVPMLLSVHFGLHFCCLFLSLTVVFDQRLWEVYTRLLLPDGNTQC